MLNKPSILPPGQAPGSHSLFDDFVWVHMNQTLFIHLTASIPVHFLAACADWPAG
jgi:hypothetical protein